MDCWKTGYESEADANKVIAKWEWYKKNKKRFKGNVPKRAYFCKHCKKWHLTKQEATREDINLIYKDKFQQLINKRQ